MSLNYSIAIRTLGTAGEKFVRELESIKRQTVQPDKVVVYIAEGYPRPDYTIGKEQYVWVKKGMMSQRVLPYTEIDSPLILLLDDDVELADDSAQKLIKALEDNSLDCIAPETHNNQQQRLSRKVYYAVTNLVFPHYSAKWAFKIHSNGSYSYNNRVTHDVYLSQSAAGPASLWRKQTFLDLRLEDELWLERFGFPYGEDALMFNKLYKNGYHLGIHYDSGIRNRYGRSSSGSFQRDPKKFYTRAAASFLIWYRTCYNLKGLTFVSKSWAAACYLIKALWLAIVHIVAAIRLRSIRVLANYFKGLLDGIKLAESPSFRDLPNYKLPG